MRGLTLTQPYATLVAIGAKKIETRSWRTEYRGLVAIHAAKAMPAEVRRLMLTRPFSESLKAHGYEPWSMVPLPRSQVVAVCRLANCIPTADVEWIDARERAFGDYSPGRWAWLLEDITKLWAPILHRGALSLWPVPEDLQRRIREAG